MGGINPDGRCSLCVINHFCYLERSGLIQPKLVLVPKKMFLVESAFWMVFQDVLQEFFVCQWRFCIQAVFHDGANQVRCRDDFVQLLEIKGSTDDILKVS